MSNDQTNGGAVSTGQPSKSQTIKAEFEGSSGPLAAALEMPAGPARAYALFAHCFSCSKDIKAARTLTRALSAQGIAVLRFDFTGLGSSQGDFANTNFSSNVTDLIKAAAFLKENYGAPDILIGHSLGGAAVIAAASAIASVKGVATIGAPSNAAHVAEQFADKRQEIEQDGAALVQLAGRPFTIKRQFIEDLQAQKVTEAAANLKKPLLILHAPLDETVGIDNATQLFVAAKHPKSFVSLDTADHLLSNINDARYAADVISAWAGRFLSDTSVPTQAPAPKQVQGQTNTQPPTPASDAITPFKGGASARLIEGEALATALSIDGHPFVIDAGTAEGGRDLGPNPTRTLEGALAACTAMTMRMYANRKKWDLKTAEVTVRRAAGEDAHAASALVKTIRLEGDLDAEQRARIQEIGGKCPVHKMLAEPIAINSVYEED